jgi:hypothetical protein
MQWLRNNWRQIELHGQLRAASIALSEFPISTALRSFGIFTVLSTAFIGVAFLTNLKRAIVIPVFIVLLLADKSVFFPNLRFFNKDNVYATTAPAVETLLKAGAADSNIRVHIPMILGAFNAQAYGSSDAKDYMLVKNLLLEGTSVPHKLHTTHGPGALRDPDYELMVRPWIERLQGAEKNRMLGLMNVKYMAEAGMKDGQFYYNGLRENPAFLPRIRLAGTVVAASSWEDGFSKLIGLGENIKHTTVLHGPDAPKEVFSGAIAHGHASRIEYTYDSITFSIQSDRRAFLVLANDYDPNWNAFIDGKETKVHMADLHMLAVSLPEGGHEVVFKYSHALFWKGMGLFAIGCALLALMLCPKIFKWRLPARPQS